MKQKPFILRLPAFLALWLVAWPFLSTLHSQDSKMEILAFEVPFKTRAAGLLTTEYEPGNYPREAFLKLIWTEAGKKTEITRAADLARHALDCETASEADRAENFRHFFDFIASPRVHYLFRDIPGVSVSASPTPDQLSMPEAEWKKLELKPAALSSEGGGFRYTRVLACYFLPDPSGKPQPGAEPKPCLIESRETLDSAGNYVFSVGKIISLESIHGVQLPDYR